MSSYYIMKAVRESYFLQTQGYENVPRVHLMVAAMTFLAAQVYTYLASRFSGKQLVAITNTFFVACILVFWMILASPNVSAPWLSRMAWVFYIWVAVFAVFVVTLFWSQAHAIFTPAQGSRLYGAIGAGGILGAALGGVITRQLVHYVGSMNLLLIAAGLLTPCIYIGLILGKGMRAIAPEKVVSREAAPATRHSVYTTFLKSPYVCGIGLLVLIYQAIGVLMDYQIHALVQTILKTQDDRTAFFGSVYLFANVLGFLIGLFVAGPVQTRWGPLPGLFSLPVLACTSATIFALHPNVQLATVMCVLGLSIQYSIHQSSRELLYLPTTAEVKFAAKGFIDTFLFRAGNGAAAVWLILDPPAGGGKEVSFRIIPIALVMSLTACLMDRAYRRRILGETSGQLAA
jgi:AAA family ATP:ADP antiporter